MDNSVAHALVVFSPILYWQLWLSFRYTAVNIKLRAVHSKTYLKKNAGNLWQWLFLIKFKDELPISLYLSHLLLLWMTLVSVLIAIIYGISWIAGCHIHPEWLPWLYIRIDIIVSACNAVKIICDKVSQ